MNDKCQVTIFSSGSSYHSHKCRRPFKTAEQREAGLCGIHLAAKQRREDKYAQRQAHAERSLDNYGDAQKLVNELDAYGVSASPHHVRPINGPAITTGGIVLDAEQARRLLDLLAAAEVKS